jgi:hypothetical protein
MKKPEALVTGEGLYLPGLPIIPIPSTRTGIENTSWGIWLNSNRKFRCELGENFTFTAYKSAKSYWAAQRRVNGKLRNLYLGQSHDLIFPRLWEIAKEISVPDSEYWEEIPAPSKGEIEELKAQVAMLLAENENLRKELASLTAAGALR